MSKFSLKDLGDLSAFERDTVAGLTAEIAESADELRGPDSPQARDHIDALKLIKDRTRAVELRNASLEFDIQEAKSKFLEGERARQMEILAGATDDGRRLPAQAGNNHKSATSVFGTGGRSMLENESALRQSRRGLSVDDLDFSSVGNLKEMSKALTSSMLKSTDPEMSMTQMRNIQAWMTFGGVGRPWLFANEVCLAAFIDYLKTEGIILDDEHPLEFYYHGMSRGVDCPFIIDYLNFIKKVNGISDKDFLKFVTEYCGIMLYCGIGIIGVLLYESEYEYMSDGIILFCCYHILLWCVS